MARKNIQKVNHFASNFGVKTFKEEFIIMTGDLVQAAKFIGAGLSMIGALGAGTGIGLVVNGALGGMARNPDSYGQLLTIMILGIAFAEAIAIYCLVIAFLMLFVL
jgi:F-type H+-transporting ATPase subunit c